MIPAQVKIVEVGARDGLQNEKEFVPTQTKIELVNRLARAGLRNVESASFVSPKWVPQMADATVVMAGIERLSGTLYSVLTPNMRGFEGALESKADEIVIFGAASEAFSQKNINCSIAESIARFEPVAKAAKDAGMRLRGSISCAFGCPYQGEVSIESVVDVVKRIKALGCDEIDIADTIGIGTPKRTREVMAAASNVFPRERLSGHFHDTYGQAIGNIYAALLEGIEIFHTSVAGLGGCPYAKGATSNVATEDVVYLLNGLGIETGVDLDQLVEIGDFISRAIGKPNASRAGKALLAKRQSGAAACV
ncbi:Hydroxymethylglutaryl-CoA lyase [Candidatus Burkholderia humilis]|nr:Hydroxymethylglutaryl-CoA lyase [Candidatus Burkholderia humilis]